MLTRCILVPLDGSAFSETALPWAFHIAKAWDAGVEVATVHEPVPTLDYDLWEKASREWTDHYVKRVRERIAETVGLQVDGSVLAGSVPEALERLVEEHDVDLVVMATHGRGPLSRAWLGSTADAFVRHTKAPVLLVRPESEDVEVDLAARPTIRHILVPLDGSREAEAVLEWARALAAVDGGRITLLRVFPYPEEFASAYLPHTVQINTELLDEGRQRAREYIEAEVAKLRDQGYEVDGDVVVDSSPAQGIVHWAGEHPVDVIAMATHGRGGVSRLLLGSVTDKVLRSAHIPVLAFRPPAAAKEDEA
ncbi:MAG: universal stress protein [Gemmatimonadetes bacterium]|nr:MAG: universal stress protein [Gemmatimonadota bacterium]